jgi:spore coat polysaccharide biosynthesis protein SpsF
MSKTIACVIARTTSSRLPLKILRNVTEEYTMIDFILQRLKSVSSIDKIYLCTSAEIVDDIMEDVSNKNEVELYRGSANSVIDRIIAVGEMERADNIVRVTGDNVFTSVEYLDAQISIHNNEALDYTRIVGVPLGSTAEVIRLSALKHCIENIDPEVSEYLMLYMFCPDTYRCGTVSINGLNHTSGYSLTVDTCDDLARTKKIFNEYKDKPLNITTKQIVTIIDDCKLDHAIIDSTGIVKMPHGLEISFTEFQENMHHRHKASANFILDV